MISKSLLILTLMPKKKINKQRMKKKSRKKGRPKRKMKKSVAKKQEKTKSKKSNFQMITLGRNFRICTKALTKYNKMNLLKLAIETFG